MTTEDAPRALDSDAGQERTTDSQTEAAHQAMAGLRAIWTATGQMQEESLGLECRPGPEGCSASVGFDGLADAMEPTTDTADAIARLRLGWKSTLAREGKLRDPGDDCA